MMLIGSLLVEPVDPGDVAVKTLTWTDATSCADIVREAEREDVVLMREGHAVALVTPFDDDDLEWYVREHDAEFLQSIARARTQVAPHRTTKHEDQKRELGLD